MSASRFVVLEHDHPFLHWDLLLEEGSVLKAWRLLQPIRPEVWIPSESLPDHRPFYLDYEGPVSRNRGTVKRLFEGRYRVEETGEQATLYAFTHNEFSRGTLRITGETMDWYFE